MHRSGSDSDSDKAHWYMSNSDDESFVDKDKDCRRGTVALLLKKGPWTSWENSILEKYIKKHGERNWKIVQKNTGLLSNILDRRLASKDYDSIEDQRNRIEVAAEYEISLPVLKTTNNDIFPSASIFANHGISNGNLSALSTTDALQMELPLIQFDPNNQFIYSRAYATHLTNLALLNDQSEELLNHIDVLNYVVMKEELSRGSLSPTINMPCEATAYSSELPLCKGYREQDLDFYTQ
uniref:Myb-like domain-containing protein n=1 Tax=Oryza nivara TaxID=4536 RepID=A0A0E0FIS7_ORYNI